MSEVIFTQADLSLTMDFLTKSLEMNKGVIKTDTYFFPGSTPTLISRLRKFCDVVEAADELPDLEDDVEDVVEEDVIVIDDDDEPEAPVVIKPSLKRRLPEEVPAVPHKMMKPVDPFEIKKTENLKRLSACRDLFVKNTLFNSLSAKDQMTVTHLTWTAKAKTHFDDLMTRNVDNAYKTHLALKMSEVTNKIHLQSLSREIYKDLNRYILGGILPEMPIKWTPHLKRAYGQTNILSDGTSTFIEMCLNSNQDVQTMVDTLTHEVAHVVVGLLLGHNPLDFHSPIFQYVLRNINEAVGIATVYTTKCAVLRYASYCPLCKKIDEHIQVDWLKAAQTSMRNTQGCMSECGKCKNFAYLFRRLVNKKQSSTKDKNIVEYQLVDKVTDKVTLDSMKQMFSRNKFVQTMSVNARLYKNVKSLEIKLMIL